MRKQITILILIAPLFGVPKFSIQNGAFCGLCHVNPTGGALRNDHGITIVSIEDLPAQVNDTNYENNYTGLLNDFLRVGGDFRIQEFSYQTGKDRYHAWIPMQGEVYAYVSPTSSLGIYAEWDLNPGGAGSQFWAILQDLPFNSWIKIGKTLPNFGLRLDDHSSFIRGGPVSQFYGISANLLPFSPFTPKPLLVEMGIKPHRSILWTTSVGNPMFSSNISPAELSDKNLTSQIQYSANFGGITFLFSAQGMWESKKRILGVSGGFCIGPLTWEHETDWASATRSDSLDGLAIHHLISFEMKDGFSIIGLHEFVDPDLDWKSGAVSRIGLGFEYFPIPFLEIKFQTRMYGTNNLNGYSIKPEYILQIHTWF